MAQTIKIKRSATSGNKLTGSNSVAGEIGMNTADKALYIQTGSANGDVVTVAHESTLKIDEVNNRVGIGTTSPSVPLHVNGFARFSDIQLTGTDPQVAAISNTSLVFKTNNTEVARFDASGNLGIGETTPSAPLHIGGDGRVAIFGDNSFDDKYIELREGGTTGFRMGLRTNLVDSSGCILLQTGDDKGFGIAVNTTADWGSVATSSIPFYVAEGGNVGIGTTSPTYHFHVDAGNSSTTALFESDGVANVVVSGGTNRGSFVVQHSGTTSGALIAKSGGGLEFGVGANYATNVRMVLDSNGAVTFNDAFTFPTAIGSPGQVLKVPTSGTTLYWANEAAASVGTSIADADGDTKIQVEKTADEDKIRFDTGGTERVVIDSTGLAVTTAGVNGLILNEDTSDTQNSARLFFKGSGGTVGLLNVANELSFRTGMTVSSTSGTERFNIHTNAVTAQVQFRSVDGSAATPGISFATDTNTGIFRAGSDLIGIATNATERVRIDNTGRVGIGTTSPSQMLHVNGGAARLTGDSADDSLVLQLGQMETSGNPMWSIYSDDVGTDKLEFTTTRWGASYYWTRGSAAGARVNMMQLNRLSTGDKHWSELSLWTQADASATGSITTTKDISFNAGSSSYIKGGNLGIGTTSPNRQLHIYGSGATVAAKIEASDGNQASVDIKNSEGEFRIISDSGELSIYDQTDTTERLRIDTAGFVGIGTTNPLYQLDVHTTTGTALNVQDDNGWATIRVKGGGDTDNVLELANFGSAGSGSLIRTTGTGHLRLFSGNTEAIRIDGTTQNVGVGETTPSAVLHVTTDTDADGIIIQRNSTTGGTSAQLGFMPSTNSSGTPNLWIKGIRGAGSYNDNYMTFGTNSLERMRINAAGNIGIGTTSPSQKLQVAGTILADTTLAASSGDTAIGIGAESNIADTSSTYKTKLITDNNNAKLTTYQYSSYLTLKAGVEGSSYANNWAKIELRDGGGTGSNNGHMKFYTQGTERINITNSGNVGIGTSSPTSELQVGDGTTNATIKAYYSDNTYAELAGYGVQFNRSTSYLRPTTNGDKQLEIGGSSLNWNKIINWADTSFLFSGGGNVGIGSTDPQAVLDLGNATQGRGIAWGGPSGTSHYNTIWSEYSTASIIIGAGLKGATGSTTFLNPFTGTYGYAAIELDSFSDDGIKFYTGADAARTKDAAITPTEQMRLTNAGRLGIGTTSPVQKLDVQDGFIRVQSPDVGGVAPPVITIGQMTNAYQAGLSSNVHLSMKTTNNVGNFYWYLNSTTPTMTLLNTGNLGLGTTAPTSELEVKAATPVVTVYATTLTGTTLGDKGPKLLFKADSSTAGNGGEIVFAGAGDTNVERWAAISGHISSNTVDGCAGHLVFATKETSAGTSLSERMRITNSGNIGIGTTSPSQRLQVEGNVKLDNGSHITWSDTDNNDGRVKIEGDESLDRILLKVDNSNSKVINLTSSGVGIGSTTTPSYNLDVTGTGRFTGAVTMDSALTFSATNASNMLNLSNNNIVGVNLLQFSDAGPSEGLSWNGGNTKIYESPDDLTTNSAGNLQLVYNNTRRLTVNNTGIDVNGTITGATNISKKAATTATGGIGTEDGTNTWAKLATYSTTQNYSDASFVYSVVTEEQGSTSAGIITVQVRWYDISGSNNPELKISWVGLNSGATLDYQSFKLINDGVAEDIELWVQKKSTYSEVELWETAYNKEGAVTVTYETNSAWQSSTPTGTTVNVTSGPLTFDGKEVIVGDNFTNVTDVTIDGRVTADTLTLKEYGGDTITLTPDPAFSNAPSHGIVHTAYQTTLGDYITLKASGNSTSGHGVIGVADNGVYFGKTDVENSSHQMSNSATAPLDTTYGFINSSGLNTSKLAINTLTPYSGTRAQICASSTSFSMNSTAISNTTLVLSNSDDDYGTVFATGGSGKGYIQQRRTATATYYDLSLQPYGGNLGIGTDAPIQYVNTGSYFKPDTNGKFLTINGDGNGSFIMLESTSNTSGDQIGGLYFTDGTGQSDAHRQVAGIDAIVASHATNTLLDGADLRFFTKPIGGGATDPRMTIKSTGFVGINTNNPAYQLDLSSGTTNIAARFFSTDTTTNVMLQDGSATTYFSTSNGNAYFGGAAGLSANNLTLVQSTGNVGIGDYTPNFKLHVNSGTTNVVATFESEDNEAWINLKDDVGGTYGCLIGFDSDNSNLFKIADSSVNTKFTLKGTGRVGIGIEDPTEMLEVYTNGSRSAVRIHEDAGTDVARLHLRTGGNDTHIQNDPSNGFEIRTENNLVNADPALRIQGGGNATFGYDVKIKELGIDTTETSTTATTQVAIDSFAAATFRSARYTIQVTNSTDSTYHITEILLIHDGTTPQITEYGTIFTGSAEATFDADISSGNVRLLATPATSDSMTFKVVRHCITV